ncbi:DUF6685 family protein [Atopomonas sediminilitoris]|uniref:DUF6685 family protein n=1 Tax=Atopomonas sediminilitoris TaxID=2919919 RepID=UPI001F4D91EA|nr:DUF6685 family protein [Atopomonas sediminilitoris]MCJ8169000.1 hypothetical protein [Atopomonas sediminilitoris]
MFESLPFFNRLALAAHRPAAIARAAAAIKVNPVDPRWGDQSIFWEAGLPLQNLINMPKRRLSGPVKEVKDAAWQALHNLIEEHTLREEHFDLRRLGGLVYTAEFADHDFTKLEQLAASSLAEDFRVKSYGDFMQALGRAFSAVGTASFLELYQASWHGQRLFWGFSKGGLAMACAVSYAREHNLEQSVPASIHHLQLRPEGLEQLEEQFICLLLEKSLFSEKQLIQLLAEHHVLYARLVLSTDARHPDLLLLPRSAASSQAVGEGLLQAGATAMGDCLRESSKTA